MSVRSMTGYARVRRTGEAGEVVVAVKSVNHRGFDLHLHLPMDLEALEPQVRQKVRESVGRGHIDLRMAFIPTRKAEGQGLNRPLFEAYLDAVRIAGEEFGIVGTPDLAVALRIPGMLTPPREDEVAPEVEALAAEAVTEALTLFNQFREREGAATANLMNQCCERLIELAGEMEALRAEALPVFRSRLDERLKELLGGASLEPQRLAQEAALLADRSDIAEETGRLQVHAKELEHLLSRGGEIGKKLDFLLQEMNRESNTILSKTSNAGEMGLRLTALGLEAKTNIERIREQALNVE